MPYRGFWPHFKATFNFLFMTCRLLKLPFTTITWDACVPMHNLATQCFSMNLLKFTKISDIIVTPHYNIHNNFIRLQTCTSVLLCKSMSCCLHFGGISHWQTAKNINTLTKPTICNSDQKKDWNAKSKQEDRRSGALRHILALRMPKPHYKPCRRHLLFKGAFLDNHVTHPPATSTRQN